jgi:phosphatidyl-myo-inositol dimannoside synthase
MGAQENPVLEHRWEESRQLLLSYDFPPIPGGIARVTGELARRYPPGSLLISTGRREGSEAVDSQLPNRVDRLGIRSTRLRTAQGLVLWSRRARQLARAFDPGFVWCGNLKPAGFPALWLHRRERIRYGIMLYGSELLLLQQRVRTSRLKRAAAKMMLGNAAVLTAISDWTRRLCLDVLDQIGWKPGEVDVRTIPLGTDPEHFRPGLDTRAVRARYGLDDGRWLLTVARLVGHKGIDTGLKVVAGLRDAYPDLRYAIVGSGPTQSQLETLARDLGIQDAVRFLTGVPDDDLPALYNCAEIYLGLSRPEGLLIEGFGISLVEASACGIPVIGACQGGIPDAVRDGETGILVDSTDLRAVVEVVRALLGDQELAGRLGRGGRRAVATYFNWDRVTADVRRTGNEFARMTHFPELGPSVPTHKTGIDSSGTREVSGSHS